MAVDRLARVLSDHVGLGRHVDGVASIRRLRYAPLDQPPHPPEASARLVLILVESRLLRPLDGAQKLDVRIARLAADLRREGYDARVIDTALYDGVDQRDGETLLALRAVLIDVRSLFARFEGVILIGRFPEAQIVRRFPWAPAFRQADFPGGAKADGVRYLAIESEPLADSADVVLGDLSGNWDRLYQRRAVTQRIRALPAAELDDAGWPVAAREFVAEPGRWEVADREWEDVFRIEETRTSIAARSPTLRVSFDRFRRDPEVAVTARNSQNPIATPEIAVSRLNAYHVALRPPEDAALSAENLPQEFSSTRAYPLRSEAGDGHAAITEQAFQPDALLERRLLSDYLDRNHRFRTGRWADANEWVAAAAFAFDAQAGIDMLRGALPDAAARPFNDATLEDYARFWRAPGLLRSIVAHSDHRISAFGPAYKAGNLLDEIGGNPFRWVARSNGATTTYTPSVAGAGAMAEFWLHRTLWQNRRVHEVPSFVFHGGCGAVSAERPFAEPYSSIDYARSQNANGILFYCNALAVVARSKVFNDDPSGIVTQLAEPNIQLGDAWRRWFRRQTTAPAEGSNPGERAARSKKVYPWILLGDWTLRLRPRPR